MGAFNIQVPFQALYSLFDPLQPKPTALVNSLHVKAQSIVNHFQQNATFIVFNMDANLSCFGMLNHIVQAFLGDPVQFFLNHNGQASFPFPKDFGFQPGSIFHRR
jgi:hypothetical protein